MRKPLYVLLILFLLSLSGVYLFIPSTIIISKAEEVESSERIIAKFFNTNINRRKWWPTTEPILSTDSTVLEYDKFKFDFKNPGYNSNEILIKNAEFTFTSIVTWDLSQKSLVTIRWKAYFQASYNPITRVSQYLQAHKVKRHMTAILKSLHTFVEDSHNVYGFKIERETVKDTILATSTTVSSSHLNIYELYSRINYLTQYIKEQRAKQVNPPMVNIFRDEHQAYRTVIAIPINKSIDPSTDVLINRMVPGNILVTQIKGGPHKIEEGFNQMKIYLKDFKLTSPAMPFESLVTNRLLEQDTSKWVTRLYYPIF